MPEGHAVHRLAREVTRRFGGRAVRVDSPQGRFAAGAALLDGQRLADADARGKHLLAGFRPASAPAGTPPERWLHVHLGLYGKWAFGEGEPPEPRGALRLRMVTADDDAEADRRWAELRGPTACDVLDAGEVAALGARLGPDPLRADADPAAFAARAGASRTSIAALLMQQEVISGVGNIYRAEVLFRARLSPFTPGRQVPADVLAAVWADLVVLMRAGVRAGRIVTTAPADRGGQRGRAGAFYVYGRAGLPCRACGTAVLTQPLAGRALSWCPSCQQPRASAVGDLPEAAVGAG